MRAPVNPVWALCCALGIASAIALPLVRVAPNRLLSGEPVFLAELLGTWSAAAWLLPLFLLGLGWRQRQAFTPRLASGNLLTSALMAIFVASLLGLAGRHASHIAATESAYARTSLGAGFWCLIILAILLSLDAVSQSRRSALRRYLWFALLALPTIILVASGFTDELSVLKEYANRSEVFWKETLRHLQIVGLATVPSVLIGLPLGWACSRSAVTQKTIFPFLNIVQTVPSLAIFGLLMGPLAWAASQFAWLGRAGISGVGLAPAVLTLLVYSLLPIARQHYYHPSQQGSWSIKAVLPALCPELHYDALDGVQDGGAAQQAYLEAITPATSAPRKAELERQLLAYCSLDTWAMVRLWSAFTGQPVRD